jgi:hypothetical protein
MSTLLFWENPLDLMNPTSCRADVWRFFRTTDLQRRVAEDVSWGFHEDSSNDDVTAIYEIRYYDSQDQMTYVLNNPDIQKMNRTEDQTILTITRTLPTGRPDVNRVIEFSNESSTGGGFYAHIVTNRRGCAKFPLARGTRILIRIQGELKALDAIVPNKAEITWQDLVASGSWVDTERRGWY